MVELYPRCRSKEVSAEFQEVLVAGWNRILDILRQIGEGTICGLDGIEISLLDDREMAEVHGEFLDDATPTDVITFEYGELLIGVETAERQAGEFGTRPDHEIALYGIHGMLHLSGFDDREPADAERMAGRQEELFREVFSEVMAKKQFF